MGELENRLVKAQKEESEHWNTFRKAFGASFGGHGGKMFDQLIGKNDQLRNLCSMRTKILLKLINAPPASSTELAELETYMVEKRKEIIADFAAHLQKSKGKTVTVAGIKLQAGYDDKFAVLAQVRVAIIFNLVIADLEWFAKQKGWVI